jgi:signal transduction histidine kinase
VVGLHHLCAHRALHPLHHLSQREGAPPCEGTFAHSMHTAEVNEAQLRLFTSIAHELRSPLTMIISPLKELMSRRPTQRHRENYQIMERNGNRHAQRGQSDYRTCARSTTGSSRSTSRR